MVVPYSPLAIANTFLERHSNGVGIEHMKLQKLVYCAYGWWLASYGMDRERLTAEGPEIWKHGPVFSSLYQALKEFGRAPILTPLSAGPLVQAETVGEDIEVIALVDWVWSRYGRMSGFDLSDLTHQVGSPWHRVAMENDFRIARHTQIPDKYIFEEFHRLLCLIRGNAVSAVETTNGRRREAGVH
ncbi:MAG: DUF4065 domain-containing protein [Cohaesibacter sp.]|jgi:uncharacterized phage-associated protein|nr:DUF4065 domain-containing protein [Cohaesibacter sp.]